MVGMKYKGRLRTAAEEVRSQKKKEKKRAKRNQLGKDIRGKEGYREVYIKEQLARDKRDSREREFPLEPIIEAVEAGTCRPPLIIELDSGRYVIDGRTRLYAALAADKNIKVTLITNEVLGEINDY